MKEVRNLLKETQVVESSTATALTLRDGSGNFKESNRVKFGSNSKLAVEHLPPAEQAISPRVKATASSSKHQPPLL